MPGTFPVFASTVRLGRLALALALLSVPTACRGPDFDRGAMLHAIGTTVILPGQEALVLEAERLDAAAAAFAAAPTEEALLELRDRWLATELAWKGVQLFQFEGLLILHNAIEKRPARDDFIEETITALNRGALVALDTGFIESAGATSKGLGAIEHLIFPAGLDPSEVVAGFVMPGRGAYLRATAENLVAKTRELQAHWAPGEGGYLTTFVANDSDGADIRGSVSRLANRIIEAHEIATQHGLGRPMGRTMDGVPHPEEVEAPLSGHSLELLVATVETLRRTMDAGVDDYLDHLDLSGNAEPLSARIAAQYAVALNALREIEGPLEVAVIARPAQVETAYEEMRALIVLLKTEMAAQLGITVTFSDTDGD
ncbi:MAG: imelysin family protein [Gemmatimonadota bacterium]